MKAKLSLSRIKQLLTYVPDTGEFIWNVSRGKAKKGSVAGVVCNNKGYVRVQIDGVLYQAHRLAWFVCYGQMPKTEIDHINGVKDNNRINNLRLANRTVNNQNRSIFSTNTSGCTGVTWDKRSKKWKANIGVNGKLKHLGEFKSFEDAKKCRKDAERNYKFHYNHGKTPCDRALDILEQQEKN